MARLDFSEGSKRQAARLKPDSDPRVFAQLADSYRREGLLEEAIQICRDGLAAHPGYVNGRVVLGQALLERGALEEAEVEFRRVLDQAPENLLSLRLLGDICTKKGRAREARGHYERLLRVNPGDRKAQDLLAALPMTPEATAAEDAGEGRGRNRDPLASPTLAALYASQGHRDVAEMIYSQLHRPTGETDAATPGREIPGRGTPPSFLLERLLSLREAARKVRGQGPAHPSRERGHGR